MCDHCATVVSFYILSLSPSHTHTHTHTWSAGGGIRGGLRDADGAAGGVLHIAALGGYAPAALRTSSSLLLLFFVLLLGGHEVIARMNPTKVTQWMHISTPQQQGAFQIIVAPMVPFRCACAAINTPTHPYNAHPHLQNTTTHIATRSWLSSRTRRGRKAPKLHPRTRRRNCGGGGSR